MRTDDDPNPKRHPDMTPSSRLPVIAPLDNIWHYFPTTRKVLRGQTLIKDGTSVQRRNHWPSTERGLGAWLSFRREKVPGIRSHRASTGHGSLDAGSPEAAQKAGIVKTPLTAAGAPSSRARGCFRGRPSPSASGLRVPRDRASVSAAGTPRFLWDPWPFGSCRRRPAA